jgi:hypothetical protein
VDRAGVLARLAASIAGGDRAAPLALRLCRACVDILGAQGGAITLAPADQERWTVCASDDVAARLEDLEEVFQLGPGQDAARTGIATALRLGDDAHDGMGEFVHQARRVAGASTIYAVPMLPVPHMIGVVTVYQADDVALRLDGEDRQFLADAVGAALLRDTETFGGGDSGLWEDRAKVHQATGMVVAQLGISPEDALALLRAHAFADESNLDDLAALVVARRFDFSRSDDSPGDERPLTEGARTDRRGPDEEPRPADPQDSIEHHDSIEDEE